jgi:hypothetical protein
MYVFVYTMILVVFVPEDIVHDVRPGNEHARPLRVYFYYCKKCELAK